MSDDGRAEPSDPEPPDTEHVTSEPVTSDPPARRPRRARRAVRPGAGEPVLPRSPDESDVGWGERTEDEADRLRREVPPHWGRD